jgi:hypothetical protein
MKSPSAFGTTFIATVLVAVLVSPLRAQSPAITGVTGSSYSNNRLTWGWEFTVGSSDILVTHLGTWDRDDNGLEASHDIGIWAVSNQALLGSTRLSSGSVHPLESGFRWKELGTPILLQANTSYRIGDDPVSPAREYMLSVAASNVTMNAQITYGGRVTNRADVFSYPETPVDGAMIGPNFKFGPSGPAVPEPALVQLPFLLGLGGVGLWCRRRQRS